MFGRNPARFMSGLRLALALASTAFARSAGAQPSFVGRMHRGSFPPGSYRRSGSHGGNKCAFAQSQRAAKKAKGIAKAKARGAYTGSKIRGQRR